MRLCLCSHRCGSAHSTWLSSLLLLEDVTLETSLVRRLCNMRARWGCWVGSVGGGPHGVLAQGHLGTEIQPALCSPSLRALGLRVAGTVGRKGHLFEICSSRGVQLWSRELHLIAVFSTCIFQCRTLAISENICRPLPIGEVKMGQRSTCKDGEFGALPSQAPTSTTSSSTCHLSLLSHPRAPGRIVWAPWRR